jgi:predicted acetyltransferase
MPTLTLHPVSQADRDDLDIYFMMQHIGKQENGFHNPGNALTRAQFPGLIDRLVADSEGRDLDEDQVPQTVCWLRSPEAVLGMAKLRPRINKRLRRIGGHIGFGIRRDCRGRGYGTALLRLGIAELRALGVADVLVTCDSGNLASRAVIEANGGVMEDEEHEICRYWIYQVDSTVDLFEELKKETQ